MIGYARVYLLTLCYPDCEPSEYPLRLVIVMSQRCRILSHVLTPVEVLIVGRILTCFLSNDELNVLSNAVAGDI